MLRAAYLQLGATNVVQFVSCSMAAPGHRQHVCITCVCIAGNLSAFRVHGMQGMQAMAAVHTEELPASMACITHTGQLQFGALNLKQQLHWYTLGKRSLHAK